MNNLKTIESALQRLEALYDINHEVMDADDLGDLLTTIDELKVMQYEYNRELYVDQLIQFKSYLDLSSALPDERELQKWVEQPYTIIHGDHKVTIDNGADVYNYMVQMLQNEIDDWV